MRLGSQAGDGRGYAPAMYAKDAPAKAPTATERLYAAIGLPPPVPMAEAERREFEADLRREEAKAAEFYVKHAGQSPA
jgi:hypothetical protein